MKTTEAVEPQVSDKKSGQNILFVLSVTLFVIVCSVSAFLFFENMRLSSSIEANKNEIATYENSIEKIKSDKKIIAAELVATNRADIATTVKMGEVQKYLSELLDISRKYKMMFSGFSYNNGKVATSAVSIPETVLSGDDGVKKISRLIKDYRTGTGYLFQLSPLLSISGYEQKRVFSLEFNIAPLPPK